MRKGIFIPDITVEMFRNASLEAVEVLRAIGSMEDIEIPERPHGEWKEELASFGYVDLECSVCGCLCECVECGKQYNFCPHCGADMREGDPDDRRRD